MHDLIVKLETLIEKWENVPYTGDLTKAATSVCAKELREVIGPSATWCQDESSSDANLQKGYYSNVPF